MCARERRSHDQKRKAKLARRAERETTFEPLSSRKYQASRWTRHVYQTELGIYETILESERRLTNDQVRQALIRLIKHLHQGQPALLAEGEPAVSFQSGNEVEYLAWNIRRHWGLLFEEEGPVSNEDLIGILRTLLYSIQAHGWNTGASRGYVDFLDGFIQRCQQ
jgi:hypothetical protein